jgi:mannose-6-phosphate isomerase-like protein (cupin superfamily)
MRIAILAPLPWGDCAVDDTRLGNLIVSLADGLVARGIEVTLFAVGSCQTKAQLQSMEPPGNGGTQYDEGVRVWEALYFAGIFEQANTFDLIHNHLGSVALTYSEMTSTPVLTTIHAAPAGAALQVYKKYNQRGYYVATSTTLRSPLLNYLTTVPYGSSMVESYLEIYRRVINQRSREDHRPWGYYQILADAPDHKVKRIVVYPGKRLSLQRHRRRAEHWYVIQGEALVTCDAEELRVTSGQAVDLPQGCIHRVMNPGPGDMVFIEVQTGDYFGEDDIERIEDDFGRIV